MTTNLYPYDSSELRILFGYGTDIERQIKKLGSHIRISREKRSAPVLVYLHRWNNMEWNIQIKYCYDGNI